MEVAGLFCMGDCGRALPRRVRYCPFCGASQPEVEIISGSDTAADTSTPAPTTPAAQKDEAVTPAVIESPVPAKPVAPGAPKPPKPEAKVPQPAPEQTAVPPAATAQAKSQRSASKPLPQRRSWRWWAVAATLLILIVMRAVFSHSSAVTVEASPDSWTALNLDGFSAGTRIVFSAPGAFRVRTTSTPPVLVNGESGDADLSDLPRDGVEVRSATGSALEVVVRKSD